MSDIQKEIKEALENATPGRWKVEYAIITSVISNPEPGVSAIIGTHIAKKDAHLIANAPTWLLHQQELIEQKDAEIAKLREIQRAIVLTPMQKMSRAMEIIDKQKGADT